VTPISNRGSFIRWQAITLKQLTYAVNLILTLSVATLGFAFSLLRDKDFRLEHSNRCLFDIASLLILISITIGIWCVVNRLRDFRITTKVSKMRRDKDEAEIAPYVALYETLGRRTWCLFLTQITLFAISIVLYTVCVVLVFHNKLF
jgi:hypothetical protein